LGQKRCEEGKASGIIGLMADLAAIERQTKSGSGRNDRGSPEAVPGIAAGGWAGKRGNH